MDKTIIYLTDNSLDEEIAELCQRKLQENAQGIPIVSVSQKPIELGKNVCLGEIGRSWISLYKGILAGIEACETPYIGIAEHDVLYTPEHLAWIPPRDDTFYYNHNCWLVEYRSKHPELEGMFSYWPRRFALSQLICHKDLLKTSTEEVMRLLELGLKTEKGMKWFGEPGLIADTYRAFVEASSGRSTQLQNYLKNYVSKYTSKAFNTNYPNLDIRHSSNFTGPKRGKKRCFSLPYWGEFKDIIK